MRTKILAGIALVSLLGLTGCAAAQEEAAISPVGSWGVMDGELLDLNQSWIAFSNDGTLAASDGGAECSGFPGTWEQKGSELTLKPLGSITSSCGDATVSSATEAKISEDSLTLFDSRGNQLTEIPFISSNPGLHNEASSVKLGEKASDLAKQVQEANEGESSEDSNTPSIADSTEEDKGGRF